MEGFSVITTLGKWIGDRSLVFKYSDRNKNMLTCSKINDDIYKKYGVRKTIEGNPTRAEVIIEEGYGNWQNDEVRH